MTAKSFTAKVFVSGITKGSDGQTNLTFGPDYHDERNKEWAKYTPALAYSMTVLDEVAEGLKYGDTATVTFEFDEKAQE